MTWCKWNIRLLFVVVLLCGVIVYFVALWTENAGTAPSTTTSNNRVHSVATADVIGTISRRSIPTKINNTSWSITGGNVRSRVVQIPAIVHQTIKRKASTAAGDRTRWSQQCHQVNSDLSFFLYDDNDLSKFVQHHYPQYSELYHSLRGIYMADMARFLLMYHFGGIYMDRDFYCHRPLSCLRSAVLDLVDQETPSSPEGKNHKQTHLLITSREPLLHAVFIHNRPRTVIQDFFLATPQHPFFRWLLDEVHVDFERRRQSSSNNNNLRTSSENSIIISEKGPFSYSIERYLDWYYASKNMTLKHQFQNESLFAHRWVNVAAGSTELEVIYELDSHVLHPLMDSSNQNLHDRCSKFSKKSTSLQEAEPLTKQACHQLRQGTALAAVAGTTMVHMWTHSYFMFSSLRAWYYTGLYAEVEAQLPSSLHCPSDSTLFQLGRG